MIEFFVYFIGGFLVFMLAAMAFAAVFGAVIFWPLLTVRDRVAAIKAGAPEAWFDPLVKPLVGCYYLSLVVVGIGLFIADVTDPTSPHLWTKHVFWAILGRGRVH